MIECKLAEFYAYSEPVARKQHKCVECSAPIDKGEKHFRYKGVWGGRFGRGRQHLVCMEACMLLRDELKGGECIGFGELKEAFGDIRDYGGKGEEVWMRLRHLMAVILVRERKSGKGM